MTQNLPFLTISTPLLSNVIRLGDLYSRKKKKLHSTEIIKLFYITLVRPIIEYCSIIWDNKKMSTSNAIEKIQRQFTRLILHVPPTVLSPRYILYTQRLEKFNLSTLNKRRDLSRVLFIRSVIIGHTNDPQILAALHFNSMLKTNRAQLKFVIPAQRSLMRERNPLLACQMSYNHLSHLFHETDSMAIIKRKLMEYFH